MIGYSAIGLFQPKTPANVGSVLRAADCFGAAMVIIQGRRYEKACTDTTKAWRRLPLQHVDDLMASLPFDCRPIAIEMTTGARPLQDFVHPERAFYLFGPEDGSLPPAVLVQCAQVVSIPTAHCLNLAACVNVVLYDRLMKETTTRWTRLSQTTLRSRNDAARHSPERTKDPA